MSTQEKHDELLFIVCELVALFEDCDIIPDSEGRTRFQDVLERANAALRNLPTPDPRPAIRSAMPESARAKLPAAARTPPAGAPPAPAGLGGGQSDE